MARATSCCFLGTRIATARGRFGTLRDWVGFCATIIKRQRDGALAGSVFLPYENGYAERLIGSIRRECLDHIVILGEGHLRRVLEVYATYYNQVRPHLAVAKDAPLARPIQRFGKIVARPILSGLHHEYCRM